MRGSRGTATRIFSRVCDTMSVRRCCVYGRCKVVSISEEYMRFIG